jgi:hypothetical protein
MAAPIATSSATSSVKRLGAASDFAVYLDERERGLARDLERVLDGGVLGERARLLGEVEALDRDPLPLQPVEVGGKAHELWVH